MWKSLAVLLIAVAAVLGWMRHAGGQEASPPAQPEAQPSADVDLPRRAAKEFAPWIEDIIQQKTDVANRRFPMRRAAQDAVESQNSLRIYRKFPKLDGMDITLIGGRTLGDQTGVLLFTAVTEQGPVAFKIYHYKFGNNRHIGRVEITDEWTEIERLYTTVDVLQAPVTVPL